MTLLTRLTAILRRRYSPLMALSAMAIGCVLTLAVELWVESSPPSLVVIKAITMVKSLNGDTLMEVQSEGPPAHNCVRISQHVIYTDRTKPRQYVPLASALNGVGFGSVSSFDVLLDIPNGVSGEFVYQSRSAYFCTIWPGLLIIKESASRPYPITIAG